LAGAIMAMASLKYLYSMGRKILICQGDQLVDDAQKQNPGANCLPIRQPDG